VDGRPNCRNKAAFSNFSGVVWTLPLALADLDVAQSESELGLEPELS